MNKTKVLVVDNSRTMRHLISQILAQDPDIEIVGQAADPYEAREAMKALEPDVVTLDVEMPNMNGIEFLSKIMRLRPTPVIMISNSDGARNRGDDQGARDRRFRLHRQALVRGSRDLPRPCGKGEGRGDRPGATDAAATPRRDAGAAQFRL